jgi:hypothetical protein
MHTVLQGVCLLPRVTGTYQFLCCVVLQVPLVPIVPALSVFINLYLMLVLDVYTWIRFGVWLAIGKCVELECFTAVDLNAM